MKKNIYNFSRNQLEEYFKSKDLPIFRATQVFEGLYRQRVSTFFDIKGLKKEIMHLLDEEFYFPTMEVVDRYVSEDGTTKFLFKLSDGNLIETVLMVFNYGNSVCVSTQVGCNMGCAFCASGLTKRMKNLETAEIVFQILEVDNYLKQKGQRVSHIVVMGIGEPFDNYDNVTNFLTIVNDPKGLEIGARHITLSTCGIVPKIYDFADFPLQVNLAVSLHFPNNQLRSEYMKINKQYTLEKLFDALTYYFDKTNRRITFEYIMLHGINDSLEQAKELVSLLKGVNCYVNLIPYNETGGIFKRSDPERVNAFFDYLQKNNINVTLRKEHGHDIAAACGQLRVNKMVNK